MARIWITTLLTGLMASAIATPAMAGTGPRSDILGGHVGLGADPDAFCVDLGLTDNLTVGIDARSDDGSTAWGGVGARATYRLLGKHDGWNLALGGRLSVPTSVYASMADSRVRDVSGQVGYWGAASSYVLLSLPLTNWFILRYPIGMTYYVGAGQNGGQSWTFGSSTWLPSDGRTDAVYTPDSNVYFPALQFMPEAAFKFWGLEATLFGTSIAGMRLTF